MSKATKYKQFLNAYEELRRQEPQKFITDPASFAEFEGPSVEESRKNMAFVLRILDQVRDQPAIGETLTWNALNTITGLVTAVTNAYGQYKSNLQPPQYQGFANQLDSLAYHLRWLGVVDLVDTGAHTEQQLARLSSGLAQLETTSTEINGLRDQVRELIKPAVANALSTAFTDRKTNLFYNRLVWGGVVLVTAFASVTQTQKFGADVSAAILAAKAGASAVPLWAAALMRSMFLLPLYAAFGFSFAQYRKERDFEEQYAHKSALAISLPNYDDLVKGDAVKDQIVTGATTVVFAPPVTQTARDADTVKTLGGVKGLLEALGSLVEHLKH